MPFDPIQTLDDMVQGLDDKLQTHASKQELRQKLQDEELVADDPAAQLEALEGAIDALEDIESDAEADAVREHVRHTRESLELIWAILDRKAE